MKLQDMLDLFHTQGVHDALLYLGKEVQAIYDLIEEARQPKAATAPKPEGGKDASGS